MSAVVHEPVGDVDDEQFLGGTGSDAVDAVVSAWSLVDPGVPDRQRQRSHSTTMSTDDEEDLGVDDQHDQTRHDVDDRQFDEHDTALFTADRRHENLPAELPLYGRISGRQ